MHDTDAAWARVHRPMWVDREKAFIRAEARVAGLESECKNYRAVNAALEAANAALVEALKNTRMVSQALYDATRELGGVVMPTVEAVIAQAEAALRSAGAL